MREPGDGAPAAIEALPASIGEVAYLLVVVLGLLALLWALLRKGFLAYRARLGPTEPPLWGVPEILAVLGVYIGASLFLGALFLPLLHEKSPLGPLERALALLVYLVLCWVPALGLMLHFIRRDLGQPMATLGLRSVPWQAFAGCVPLYLLLLLPIALATIVWQLLLREAGLELQEQDLVGTFRDIARRGDIGSFAALGAGAVIVAPVCEEILFRGFIFGALRERRGAVLAAAASSALFAAVHFSLSALVPIFLLGLVLCGLYVRTGSLYPAVFFHALFNGATLTKAIYDGVKSAP